MCFCVRGSIGARDRVGWLWGALNPPVVCSAGRSGAVVPVLFFVALWFVLPGGLLCVFPCVILFLWFFGPFGIAIASLGEERES